MSKELPNGYFVRKVGNFSLYPDGENRQFETVGKLKADILSTSLGTTNNTLSWWHIEEANEKELSLVAALFLSAYQQPFYGKMRLAIFPKSYIARRLELLSTPNNGKTAIRGTSSRHFDSLDMDVNAVLWTAKQISLAKIGTHPDVKIKPVKSEDAIRYLSNHMDAIQLRELAPWLQSKLSRL